MTTPDPTLAARLAPCPFCGAIENLYVQRMDGTILHPAYRVVCDNCGASTGYTDSGGHVEAWNTRTTAEADARVKAAVLAGNAMVKQLDTMMLMLSGETAMTKSSLERALSGALDARNMWTDTIRARGVTG